MTPEQQTTALNSTTPVQSKEQAEKLVKQIADRVWELWQEEIRRTRERQGIQHRG